jgi:hypothetical protein
LQHFRTSYPDKAAMATDLQRPGGYPLSTDAALVLDDGGRFTKPTSGAFSLTMPHQRQWLIIHDHTSCDAS